MITHNGKNKFLGRKNNLDKNLYLEAEYASIIVCLLEKPYCVKSITKLLFLSLDIKYAVLSKYKNRKMDFIEVFLTPLGIKLMAHPEDLEAILKVIALLERGKWISIEGDLINVERTLPKVKIKNKFLEKIKSYDVNPIEIVNNLEMKSFLEEVLQYV